uniref:Elongation of very long chain fatty acids protein n=1 Tax=Stomoxys calcitrans TaxID=35570 RepID=A0A1I8NNS7_STOCA
MGSNMLESFTNKRLMTDDKIGGELEHDQRVYNISSVAQTEIQAIQNERLTTHPIFGSPLFMFFCIGCYLLLVLRVLPLFMMNRKPYKVEGLMKFYNILQILLNSFIFYEVTVAIFSKKDYSFTCERFDASDRRPETMKMIRPVALYYFSKFFDMFDTVFFLLRKKMNQVSFLHVYHHAIMVFGTYIYCAKFFGSHFTSAGLVNSFIHVVMYSYYLLSVMKPRTNFQSWKKTLTKMQLAQFILLGLHFTLPLLNKWCQLDKFWNSVVLMQNVFMIALFGNFYYRAYVRKVNNKKSQ